MRKLLIFVLLAAMPALILGQTRKKPVTKKPVAKPTPAVVTTAEQPHAESPAPVPTPEVGKKNGRPVQDNAGSAAQKAYTPVYVYTFERPGFDWSSIRIEHDEDGKGRAWFKHDGEQDSLDDPIELSPATLDMLKKAFGELNFLDSAEDYQYAAHDYSNMGNISITLNRGGKTRTAKFNWTDVKAAKTLMDTYRAISNEAIWKFEMTSARDNQPLLTPALVDTLDGYIRRGEITDAPHLVPYLTQLSANERLPLIARNHLTRLIAQISKSK
ncbi:MAG TPA: hypothetical protein VL501_00765 [Pyrinomonadaceae bacterium]|nr:hypothetical protein [Pyrinomonadaceae bacterium]